MKYEMLHPISEFLIMSQKKDKLYMNESFKPLKLVKHANSVKRLIAMVDVYVTVILWINHQLKRQTTKMVTTEEDTHLSRMRLKV